jgi:hypothetical protein
VARALRQHHAKQAATRLRGGETWQDHDLVFCTRNGKPLAAGNVRKLMLIKYGLEDIEEDVKVAETLFAPFDAEIIKGIKGIVEFLNCLANEYVENHAGVDADAKSEKDFGTTIGETQNVTGQGVY